MDADFEYHMLDNGSTVGRASGSLRSWEAGDVLRGPNGEFDHLPDRMYETRDELANPAPDPRYVVEEGGKGWYKVRDTETGEYVDGESERSEEAAQANADRLNSDA